MQTLKRFWVVLLLAHGARFLLAPFFDLVPQEAYYFLYSRHLAMSYFDHPPALALILRGFTEILGKSELTLRAAMFCTTAATLLLWLDLARKQLPQTWTFAAGWLVPTSMVTVTSLISTPDVPLLLFWSLTLHQLHRALFEEKNLSWLLAGLSMGLAFDSKYTAIFLPLGLFLFLTLSKPHRFWLNTVWPYAALLLALVATLPVLVWNAQHGFASFLFQTTHRAETAAGFGIKWLLHLLLTQSVLLGIPLLLLLLGLALRPWRLVPEAPAYRMFWAAFFLPMFLGFLGISWVSLVKPNWLLPAYLTGILWVSDSFGKRWHTAHFLGLGLIHLLGVFQLLAYPVRLETDDTWVGWKELGNHVRALSGKHPDCFIASADEYKTSAELRFYTQLQVYGPNVLGQRGLQFDYLNEDLSLLKNRDGLIIDSAPRDYSPEKGSEVPEMLKRHFEAVEELDPILIRNATRVLRKFRVYRGHQYLGPSH